MSPELAREVVEVVKTTEPVDHGLPGHGWTLKKILRWLNLPLLGSRGSIRDVLKKAGLSWKKCKKLLGKGNPTLRAAHLGWFAKLYEAMVGGDVTIIYIDEAHLHRDLDLGYTWSPIGGRVWRVSDCPGLSERINWYGAYDFTAGRCLIWEDGQCNTASSARFLDRVADWAGARDRRVVVIRDGAPWHRPAVLEELAEGRKMELVRLPAYSPDLNPIEGLWKWMREEVTQHHCHGSLEELGAACRTFIERINSDSMAMIDRLWPRFGLDEEVEKLRFSA